MAKPVAKPWVAPATTSGQADEPPAVNGGDVHQDDSAKEGVTPERVSKRAVRETERDPPGADDGEEDGWQSVTSSHRRAPASSSRGGGSGPRVRHAAPEKGPWRRGASQSRGGGGGGGGNDTSAANSVSPATSPSRPTAARAAPRGGAKSTPPAARNGGGGASSTSSNPWHRSPEQQTLLANGASGERDSGVSSQGSPTATPSSPDRNRNGAISAPTDASSANSTAPSSPARPTLPPPPAVNPWKPPTANGVHATAEPVIEVLAAKKPQGAVKSWPALGESVPAGKEKKPSSGAKSAPPAEKEAKPKASGGKKDKWVPLNEDIPIQYRPINGSSRGGHSGGGDGGRDGDRPPKSSRNRTREKPSRPKAQQPPRTDYGGGVEGAYFDEHALHTMAAAAQPWPAEAVAMHEGGAATFDAGAAAALPFYPGAPHHNGYAHNGFVAPPVLVPEVAPSGAALSAAILNQVEYYLSVDNLIRDLWLREQMDAEGWVALAHIASFKRMAMLTSAIGGDIGEIAATLSTSTELEVKDGKFVRRRKDWHKFLPVSMQLGGVDHSAAPLASRSGDVSPPSTSSTTFNVQAPAFVPGR